MAKVSRRRPPSRKQFKRGKPEPGGEVPGVRDVLLRLVERLRSQTYANARKLYDEGSGYDNALHAGLCEPEEFLGSGGRRADFDQQLDAWHRTFAAFFDEVVRVLYELKGDMEWVAKEAEKILPLLKEEHRRWVAVACDGHEPMQTWCAPPWLAIGMETTESVVEAVGVRTNEHLRRALRAAVGGLRIRMARENRTMGGRSEPVSTGEEVSNAAEDSEPLKIRSEEQSGAIELTPRRGSPPNVDARKSREEFLRSVLAQQGLSVHQWAKKAKLDFHTADNFLKGKSHPRAENFNALLSAIDLDVSALPK